MAATQRIGDFFFMILRGDAIPGGETVEVIEREGVDNAVFRLQGSKYTEFQLESMVDVASETAATLLMADYRALQGAGAVRLIIDGYDFGVSAKVIEVLPVVPRRTVAALLGGLNTVAGGAAVILRAQWRLKLV